MGSCGKGFNENVETSDNMLEVTKSKFIGADDTGKTGDKEHLRNKEE